MRVDALDKSGGDLLQVRKYIEAGKRSAADGRPHFDGAIITDLRADLSTFDLIHLTNIDRPVETYESFLAAKASRKPILLSPIHHSYGEIERYERLGRNGIVGQMSGLLGFRSLEYLRSCVRTRRYSQLILPTLRMVPQGMRMAQRVTLLGADKILVLTEKEKHDIALDFGEIPDEKFFYLRNGIEDTSDEDGSVSVRDIDVCMVGRIEARKNQIAVLKALNRLGVRGMFVGAENPNHKSYCRQFKETIADSGSVYMGSISHKETLRIMKRARVHVSASWFEVLSLVDLEAFYAGCKVVASSSGGTREILGDKAVYVFPDSARSIEDGIREMLEQKAEDGDLHNPEGPGEPITANWSQIGERLAQLYRQLV
jgi:glycosyltransferase involved in cell wall biosynthesis